MGVRIVAAITVGGDWAGIRQLESMRFERTATPERQADA